MLFHADMKRVYRSCKLGKGLAVEALYPQFHDLAHLVTAAVSMSESRRGVTPTAMVNGQCLPQKEEKILGWYLQKTLANMERRRDNLL